MSRRIPVLLLAVLLVTPARPARAQQVPPTPALRILVVNDDGYQAPGLKALVDSLLPIAQVSVVAPYQQQSGTGHAISFRDPIKVFEFGNPYGITWYAVDAHPATVVRVALATLLDSLPDLVVSGINTGDNVGTSAWVSGTAAAAREAALNGLPAIAFSVNPTGADAYAVAAGWARRIVERLQADGRLGQPLLLNVNLQPQQPAGIRVAPMSLEIGVQRYDRRVSPRGQVYLWDEWQPPTDDPVEGTDLWWFHRGYITITPLSVDQTDRAAIPGLDRLFSEK